MGRKKKRSPDEADGVADPASIILSNFGETSTTAAEETAMPGHSYPQPGSQLPPFPDTSQRTGVSNLPAWMKENEKYGQVDHQQQSIRSTTLSSPHDVRTGSAATNPSSTDPRLAMMLMRQRSETSNQSNSNLSSNPLLHDPSQQSKLSKDTQQSNNHQHVPSSAVAPSSRSPPPPAKLKSKETASAYAIHASDGALVLSDHYISSDEEEENEPTKASVAKADEGDGKGTGTLEESSNKPKSEEDVAIVLGNSMYGIMRKGPLLMRKTQWARRDLLAATASSLGAKQDGETATDGPESDKTENNEEGEKKTVEGKVAKQEAMDPVERAAKERAARARLEELKKEEARRVESSENAGRDPCLFSKRTAFDIRMDQIDDKPWEPKVTASGVTTSADLSEYFNYGFSEEDWVEYSERQLVVRQELTDAARQKRLPDPTIVPVMPKAPESQQPRVAVSGGGKDKEENGNDGSEEGPESSMIGPALPLPTDEKDDSLKNEDGNAENGDNDNHNGDNSEKSATIGLNGKGKDNKKGLTGQGGAWGAAAEPGSVLAQLLQQQESGAMVASVMPPVGLSRLGPSPGMPPPPPPPPPPPIVTRGKPLGPPVSMTLENQKENSFRGRDNQEGGDGESGERDNNGYHRRKRKYSEDRTIDSSSNYRESETMNRRQPYRDDDSRSHSQTRYSRHSGDRNRMDRDRDKDRARGTNPADDVSAITEVSYQMSASWRGRGRGGHGGHAGRGSFSNGGDFEKGRYSGHRGGRGGAFSSAGSDGGYDGYGGGSLGHSPATRGGYGGSSHGSNGGRGEEVGRVDRGGRGDGGVRGDGKGRGDGGGRGDGRGRGDGGGRGDGRGPGGRGRGDRGRGERGRGRGDRGRGGGGPPGSGFVGGGYPGSGYPGGGGRGEWGHGGGGGEAPFKRQRQGYDQYSGGGYDNHDGRGSDNHHFARDGRGGRGGGFPGGRGWGSYRGRGR